MIGKHFVYSALPRRFASIRCSIFSMASLSFKSCDLFSETNSANERFLGFLIVFTVLNPIVTVIMPGNGCNYYNFLKI